MNRRAAVSVLRSYWTAGLLGVAAVALLALGGLSKAALAGAGFAFVGAAITRGIDIASERRTAAAQADADRRRDLDETRRLAYMAIGARSDPQSAELRATLVNALTHHGLGTDPKVAMGHLRQLLSPDSSEAEQDEGLDWIAAQINRITNELGRT